MRCSTAEGSSVPGSRDLAMGRKLRREASAVNNGSTGLSTNSSTELEARASRLFERYAYPDWLRTHSLVVGRIAVVLAEAARLAADAEDVVLAGYLHDIGRSPLLAGDPREHNELSALILAAEGLGRCGELARRHPVYAVLDGATAPRSLAERLVYYADRRGGMRVLPLDERISETGDRHPRYAESVERARPIAHEIERELFEHLPLRPDDLERTVAARWP